MYKGIKLCQQFVRTDGERPRAERRRFMNKINGYTEEEATGLIEFIYSGKSAGKTLSYLFETYGKEHSRAKGSVRNYYYALLKLSLIHI